MKTVACIAVVFAIFGSLLPSGAAQAQPSAQVQRVKRLLSGQRYLITFRNGGALYGTYFFQEYRFCASGRYTLWGQSRKQTVLDNEQVNNWTDYGWWDVLGTGRQVVLRLTTASGRIHDTPIVALPDDRLWIRNEVTILPRGSVQC